MQPCSSRSHVPTPAAARRRQIRRLHRLTQNRPKHESGLVTYLSTKGFVSYRQAVTDEVVRGQADFI